MQHFLFLIPKKGELKILDKLLAKALANRVKEVVGKVVSKA